ncbi:GNAT family N-acetyltransferase [Paenibacillus sp. WLX1005]|uniref:GNAT family N-acetyltransferase n=1 Tax=Paenibacillus sp. WLX1005 TaxID=3243766 RepID=UPI0039843A1C
MTTINIRRAQAGDAAEIARLCEQLGYAATTEEIIERLTGSLNNEQHAIYVGELEAVPTKLAGWIHVVGRYLLESAPFVEVGGLVVDEQIRGTGLGRRLLEQGEQWGREQKYEMIRLRSAGYRLEAHQFYKHVGYDNFKMQQVFQKRL